jgi:hypothetical protein
MSGLEVSGGSRKSSSAVWEGDSSTKEDVIIAAQRLEQQQYTGEEALGFTLRCQRRSTPQASGYKASAPVMNRAAAKVSAKPDLSAIPAETKGFHSSQLNTRYNPVGLAQKDWNNGSADEPGSVAMGRWRHLIEVRSDRACGKATGKVHDTRR